MVYYLCPKKFVDVQPGGQLVFKLEGTREGCQNEIEKRGVMK